MLLLIGVIRKLSELEEPLLTEASVATRQRGTSLRLTVFPHVNSLPFCLYYSILKVCEEPWSYIPDAILPVFWRVVYWTSQFLTW